MPPSTTYQPTNQPKKLKKVIQARNIVPPSIDPPDTYVKCYVKDGERLRHKKKTRVVRHSSEPIYKQTLKYSVSLAVIACACDPSEPTFLPFHPHLNFYLLLSLLHASITCCCCCYCRAPIYSAVRL